MPVQNQPSIQNKTLKNMDYFMWRVSRLKEDLHRRDINRAYNERPRDRDETKH